ncbi:5,6-dimethylbenzimidazole synthase [Sphingomonas sp. Mn802worker]|uniref:5,6-dimethylbenzimidazole synthase n=1 Tax=Sphingomonas sp. Mn802worker TaxID=629773 RepID=UPI000378777E|nr:5,6-dimethylbenzimidazole synthase [Sphingomonas sp. Mn802worker]
MTATPPLFDAAFRERFDALLRWRRDVRHFRHEELPAGELDAILDTARLAPSVGNSQPWRFVRCCSDDLRERLASHVDQQSAAAATAITDPERAASYARLKLHGLREAPEIVAVFSDDDPAAGHRLGRATMRETLRYSTVLAIDHLWLAARVRGVALGWVSILDPAFVTALLDAPPGWSLVALLCLGYPEHETDTPELERRGWQARHPLTILMR